MVLFSPFASLLIVIGLSLVLACIGGWRRYLRETVLAIVDAGECPACGYDLRDRDRRDDALTVCPECGGAWNFNPPSPPHTVIVRLPTGLQK